MNRVTRYVEKKLSDMKKKRNANCVFDYHTLFSTSYKKPFKRDVDKMRLLFKEYKSLKRSLQSKVHEGYQGVAEGVSSEFYSIEQILSHINNKAYDVISSNSSDIADIAIYTCYEVLGKNSKTFLWQVFGNEIVENIKSKRTERFVRVPMKNKMGSLKYLWSNYGFYTLSIDEV